MEEVIFQKVQKGDVIFTLERDRRSGYPIFDQAKIVRVGESKPMASQNKDGFVNSTELVIQDSISQITVYLPSQASEGIYNGTYYTTNLNNILNELSIQKQNAQNILNNISRYEAIVAECDNILGQLNSPKVAPVAPDYEEFKATMSERMKRQETLLVRIAQELGLDKKENSKE